MIGDWWGYRPILVGLLSPFGGARLPNGLEWFAKDIDAWQGRVLLGLNMCRAVD